MARRSTSEPVAAGRYEGPAAPPVSPTAMVAVLVVVVGALYLGQRHPDPARARDPAELHAGPDRHPAAALGSGPDPVGASRWSCCCSSRCSGSARSSRARSWIWPRTCRATSGTCAPRSAICASRCRAAASSSAPPTCCAISVRSSRRHDQGAGRGGEAKSARPKARGPARAGAGAGPASRRRRRSRRCARWADRWSRRSRRRAWWWCS